MTESKLSMRGGRFSRSSLMGTMTEAQGRGPSVIKADWIDISGPRRRSRPHSIEGLDDGQLRTIRGRGITPHPTTQTGSLEFLNAGEKPSQNQSAAKILTCKSRPWGRARRLTTKDNSTADSERTNPRSFKMMLPKTILDQSLQVRSY